MSPPSVDPGGHERVEPPEDACRRELVGDVIAGSRGATIVHHRTGEEEEGISSAAQIDEAPALSM
jgi:hypothetical protein